MGSQGKLKDWICWDCEHEVISEEWPEPIYWDDGHVCHFSLNVFQDTKEDVE